MMLKSVERLLEFVGDMNATEINDHIKACPDGIAVSFRIDNEWLDGWNRAVLATVEKIEQEVSERFMELPVDADGVPIRVGDVMEERSGHTFEVASLMAFGGNDNWLVLSDARNFSSFREPSGIRHYHEPTVEDVLRDMLDSLDLDPTSHVDTGAVVAEYAQRLQLREVDE